MIEALIYGLLGVIFTLIALYMWWAYNTPKTIVLDDPTDDPDYQEIVKQLHCPDCNSTDFYYTEVTDLSWIKGEDRFCVCRQCGRQFGDGK